MEDIDLDKESYLKEFIEWTPEWAEVLASQDQLNLSSDHWPVIYFLRDFYQKYVAVPPMRIVVAEMRRQLGEEKGNSLYLAQLFPKGLAKQASRIAGLPKSPRCT